MRVPYTEVQNNFGRYLKYAAVNEEIIITKKGKDIAKIISCNEISDEGVKESAAGYATKSDRVTYEEYLELVENSEQRYELIDGVVYNLASPSFNHQRIIHELHEVLYYWFKNKKCIPLTAPFDVTFLKDKDNVCVVQPDIVVLCDMENIDSYGKYTGIPTIVIEVLSPTTRSKDMLKKLEVYKRYGAREYWIVDSQNEQVFIYLMEDYDIKDSKVYKNSADKYAKSCHFDGLQVSLADLFSII